MLGLVGLGEERTQLRWLADAGVHADLCGRGGRRGNTGGTMVTDVVPVPETASV